jgi:hypothetical protein
MHESSVALRPLTVGNRFLRKTRFPLCWFALVAGLGVTDQAVEAQAVGPFGATASYSYNGMLADSSGFKPEIISKSETASSLGFTNFQPVAVSNESIFPGPLGTTTASATVRAFALGPQIGVRIMDRVDAVEAISGADLGVDAKASLFDVFTLGTPGDATAGKTVHLTNAMTLTGVTDHSEAFVIPTPVNGNDFVEAGVTVGLFITGSGIAPGPYSGGRYFNTVDAASASAGGLIHIENAAPPTVTFAMDFIVGQPTPVFWSIEGNGVAIVNDRDALTHFHGQASFDEDFSHTLTWGPVTTVTDAVTGEVIHDWTITSQSGFDYGSPVSDGSPVPEPATLVLFGVGFAALAGTAAWRRRSLTWMLRERATGPLLFRGCARLP